MTKAEAKRWVIARIATAIRAGILEDEATEALDQDDGRRVSDAADELVREMRRRARMDEPVTGGA